MIQTKLRSDRIREGRFFQGGAVESTPNAIGWIDMKVFPHDPTDIVVTLSARYHHKPWLLAYDAYGKPWLSWFILQYNNVINELDEFVTGSQIVLPTSSRLNNQLLSTSVAERLKI